MALSCQNVFLNSLWNQLSLRKLGEGDTLYIQDKLVLIGLPSGLRSWVLATDRYRYQRSANMLLFKIECHHFTNKWYFSCHSLNFWFALLFTLLVIPLNTLVSHTSILLLKKWLAENWVSARDGVISTRCYGLLRAREPRRAKNYPPSYLSDLSAR